MTDPKSVVVYRGTESFSAIYIDGILEDAGDDSLVQETLEHVLGIRTVRSDDFLQGGQSREDVASSLAEIEEYQELKRRGEAEPQLLERYADELEEESAILEGRARILREEAEKSREAGAPTEEALRLMEQLKGSLSAC